jgi:hypothetical protein
MTVWDAYLLLLYRLGLGPHPLPDQAEQADAELGRITWTPSGRQFSLSSLGWVAVPSAILLALIGQAVLLGQRDAFVGLAGLTVGSGLLVYEVWRLQLSTGSMNRSGAVVEAVMLPGLDAQAGEATVRWTFVIGAYLATALTFVFSANNDFNVIALTAWAASLALWVAAFWNGNLAAGIGRLAPLLDLFSRPRFILKGSRTWLLLLAILAVSAWLRFDQLDTVPAAMTSDHVEKLIDVNDILNNGKRPIFEPSNGGREPMEFYLAALTANFTGLNYFTLKLVTAAAGFATLPFIFLLAKEITDDGPTALLATLAAGIGWWPNVISRNGLRFPFAMLFAAIVLWLAIRALKRDRLNALLLASVTLGIGLYGYTPARILPVAVILAFTLYGLHRRSRSMLLKLISWFAIFMMIVVAAFMPMIRYAVDEPGNFWRRTTTRITGEPGLETPPATWQVLLDNEWNSLRMFQWTSDSAWLVSPADTPALDWVMGACFFLGMVFLTFRYLRYRKWLDLFLILAVPVLLLPSTLALAFPVENPSLHRSGAAIPIVFIIVAMPLKLLLDYGKRLTPRWWGSLAGGAAVALLLLVSAQDNYTILFGRYAAQYKSSVPNSPELGQVVRGWIDSIGAADTVVIKAFPYWVDTRAVGYYAGQPGWNNVALDVAGLKNLATDPWPKLYVLNRYDQDAIAFLRSTYPQGRLAVHASDYKDQDFLTYYVPGQADFDEKLLPPKP